MPFEICAKRLTHENYSCKRLQVRKADLETCAPIFSILWGFNCLLIIIMYTLYKSPTYKGCVQ